MLLTREDPVEGWLSGSVEAVYEKILLEWSILKEMHKDSERDRLIARQNAAMKVLTMYVNNKMCLELKFDNCDREITIGC